MNVAFDKFHNIDDFENGAASTTHGTKRKKQKNASAGLDPSDAQEPKRLENGNWMCNHKCRDRNKCKHTCCREGLEKKPRPKASKPDADESAGVKQTQLNLPVKKKPKASAQTSSTQAQRSELVATIKSSKASGMGRAKPTYGYLASDPLNMDFGSADRPALSRSGQNTSNFAQAARNAEQYSSDDFDTLDLTGSHEVQSGLFASENDDAASSGHDRSLKRPRMIAPFQRDAVQSPSEFRGFNRDSGLDFSDAGPSPMDVNPPASAKKSKRPPRDAEDPQLGILGNTSRPFVEASSDSPAIDFSGLGQQNDSNRDHWAVNVPENSICETTVCGEAPQPKDSASTAGVLGGATQDSGTGPEMLMDWLGPDIFNFVD